MENKNNDYAHPLYVLTTSDQKIEEIREILGIYVRKIVPKSSFREIQSINIEDVIKHKAKEAYSLNENKPVLVEHTGLYLHCLSGFPGALTDSFFRTIGNRKICNLVENDRRATAKTTIGFYNGFHVFYWTGKINGKISETPAGKNGFGWDNIFIPNGALNKSKRTFGQMKTDEKNHFSMRRKALTSFKVFFNIKNSNDIAKMINLDFESSSDIFFKLFYRNKKKSALFNPGQQSSKISQILEFNNKSAIMYCGKEILSWENIARLNMAIGTINNFTGDEPLGDCYAFKLGDELSIENAKKIDVGIAKYEPDAYSTYGDSILKYLRNYILTSIPVDTEDAFNILRASNARFYDEALKMRTAFGEALYFNPQEMISPIKYVVNAFQKNLSDKDTNSVFRTYVLPEIASICVYLNEDIKRFSNSKEGYFYVPVISLAEVIAFILRKRFGSNTEDLKEFITPYLSQKKNYSINDIINNWAYKSFDMFPDKIKEAELHLKIIAYVLGENNYSVLAKQLNKPETFTELLKVFMTYRDLLKGYSRNIVEFGNMLNNVFPDEKINFTEIVCLEPGLKSRKFQIPHTPDPLLVYLQGRIDYPYTDQTEINQIINSHNISRQFVSDKTLLISIIDKDGNPVVNADHYSKLSLIDREVKIYIDSVILRYFTVLLISGHQQQSQDELIRLWEQSR